MWCTSCCCKADNSLHNIILCDLPFINACVLTTQRNHQCHAMVRLHILAVVSIHYYLLILDVHTYILATTIVTCIFITLLEVKKPQFYKTLKINF